DEAGKQGHHKNNSNSDGTQNEGREKLNWNNQQVQSRRKVRNNQRRLDVLTEAIALGACVNHCDVRCGSQNNRHTNSSGCGDIQCRNNRGDMPEKGAEENSRQQPQEATTFLLTQEVCGNL